MLILDPHSDKQRPSFFEWSCFVDENIVWGLYESVSILSDAEFEIDIDIVI